MKHHIHLIYPLSPHLSALALAPIINHMKERQKRQVHIGHTYPPTPFRVSKKYIYNVLFWACKVRWVICIHTCISRVSEYIYLSIPSNTLPMPRIGMYLRILELESRKLESRIFVPFLLFLPSIPSFYSLLLFPPSIFPFFLPSSNYRYYARKAR